MASLGYSKLEFMMREMASLARAGIPLPDGLRKLAESAEDGRIREAYGQIAKQLDQGRSLSEAMAALSAPADFVAAIRCAEYSGEMSEVLEYAIEHCRRVDRFYGKLANLLLYPVLVMALAFPILVMLGMYVVPKFQDIFEQLGGDLPAPTQLLVNFGAIMSQGRVGYVLLALAVLVLVWCCSPLFMRSMPFLLQRLPFFNRMVLLSDVAMLMRFLERMLPRGLPLPQILLAASLSVWSKPLQSRLQQMAEQAEKGLQVFGSLQGVIPALPLHLLRTAEARGDLVESCPGVARYCEERFEIGSQVHLTRLEPLLIIMLGFMVGGAVICLYLPLFKIPTMIR